MTTKIEKISTRLMATAFVYIWFVITTKCTSGYILAIILIIILTYITNEYFKNISEKNEEEKEYYQNLNKKISKFSFFICLVISLVGFVIYYNKQKKDYGPNFKLSTFIFGVQNCKST